ncbi:MAG: alkaline phosphatase D family protein, partial [Planctomycetota bacterium]|nr:alkaline phosphatase D family protein [Planctomycetota bacterium]
MTAFSIVSHTSCNTYFQCIFALSISVLALAMTDLAGQELGHRNQSDDPVVHAQKTQHGELQGSSSMPIHRLVYGSCIKQNQPMPIFREMLKKKPDLALLIGDNIYGDSEDMSVIRSKYQMLRRNSDYARFEDNVPILATWDDHDYGQNDGGADFLQRHNSQKEFLSFWNVPRQSIRWRREGVYHSKIYGEAGHRLQVILLDTRFFRSPLRKGETRRVAGPYVPDEDPAKTMLGDSQWKWLDEQLRVPAEVRLIVSSIQCIAEAAGQETWS